MTLDATTAPSITTIPDLASHYGELLEMIGSLVDFGLRGVKDDVERWLTWVLTSGTRPQPTKRAMFANGINAYATTQDAVCAVLDRLAHTLDWDNPIHFWLIERATRPLDQTCRHPQDVKFWNNKRRAARA